MNTSDFSVQSVTFEAKDNQIPFVATVLSYEEYLKHLEAGDLQTYGYTEALKKLDEEDKRYKAEFNAALKRFCDELGIP